MAKKTILQSWSKRLRHLIIYTWSVHFPIIPLPLPLPPGQSVVVQAKNYRKIFYSVWNSTFFGGGGGNLGIAVFQTVNWRSLSNFLPKRGGVEIREVSQTLLTRIVRYVNCSRGSLKRYFFELFLTSPWPDTCNVWVFDMFWKLK